MGCCGEPIDTPTPGDSNRVTPFDTKAVTQQPSRQPGIQWQAEKQDFQQPIIPSPPPTLQYGQAQQPISPYNGTFPLHNGLQQQWTHSQQQVNAFGTPSFNPSSPPTIFNGSDLGQSPFTRSSTPSTYVGNPLNAYNPPPLAHPTGAHHGASMSISGRRTASPPAQLSGYVTTADEGKLSVSIDFGELLVCLDDR